MENRFALKDFILLVMILIVGILVIVAMRQFDRQWDRVQSIESELRDVRRELRDELRTLQGTIDERLPASTTRPATPPPATEAPQQVGAVPPPTGEGAAVIEAAAVDTQATSPEQRDPFARMREARRMPNFSQGDWLVEAFSGQIAKLTPLLSGDASASAVQSHVLESLATRDPDTLEWAPLLARDWQISEDALRITFQLRPGVRFSDGTPLTADDVVFTFNFIMNPEIAAPRHRAYFQKIERVEKSGPLEVTFVFREPYFESFELAASMEILPKHFYGSFSPQEFNASVGLLMGSGPYRMENPRSWRPGQLIRLVRNERYWGVPPAFDQIVYREISNDVARLTSFQNGEHDTFSALPEQYRELLKNTALLARTQHFEYQTPIGGYRYVAWNQKRKDQPTYFADKRVRQAMAMLVDRQSLIENVMLGYAVQATGPFNPLGKQSNPSVEPWPYDPDRGLALLEEAGFTQRTTGGWTWHIVLVALGGIVGLRLCLVGRPAHLAAGAVAVLLITTVVLAAVPRRQMPEGILRGPDGQPFRFKLTYPAGSANYERMVLLLKDSYARVGIIVEPDPLEWAVFTERLNQKDFEAITLGWTSGIETDIYQMFHSSQALEGGDNFISYVNTELDAMIDKARSTVREAERIPLWHRAHQILHEDQPYMFLFFPKAMVFIDNRIENIGLTRLGLNSRYEWFVPRAQQRWTR